MPLVAAIPIRVKVTCLDHERIPIMSNELIATVPLGGSEAEHGLVEFYETYFVLLTTGSTKKPGFGIDKMQAERMRNSEYLMPYRSVRGLRKKVGSDGETTEVSISTSAFRTNHDWNITDGSCDEKDLIYAYLVSKL